MFNKKTILITGGTGSLGQSLTKRLLDFDVESIRILSRNENKQVEMESKFSDDRLRFFIGDVRDLPRLNRAFEDVDIVFHTAALKHVPEIEYNPFEAIKTNVYGSQNVIDACIKEDVGQVVGISTDKAVSPLNTYGATKLLMEKIFTTASNYSSTRTKFLVVRYGNVFGSSGSVIPKFISQIKEKRKVTITDLNMTRFSITVNEALDFILESTNLSKGSEIFVPKLKAFTLHDLIEALKDIYGKVDDEVIGIRRGEKLHEFLISQDEMRYTWELENKFLVFNPSYREYLSIQKSHPKITKVKSTQEYNSELAEKLSKDELKKYISELRLTN